MLALSAISDSSPGWTSSSGSCSFVTGLWNVLWIWSFSLSCKGLLLNHIYPALWHPRWWWHFLHWDQAWALAYPLLWSNLPLADPCHGQRLWQKSSFEIWLRHYFVRWLLSNFHASCSEKPQTMFVIKQYAFSTHPTYNRYKPLKVKANTDEDDGSPKLEVLPRLSEQLSLGLFSLEKAEWRLHWSLWLSQGDKGEGGADLLPLVTSERTWGDGRKLHWGKFRLNIRKSFFTEKMVGCWSRVPREVVVAPRLTVQIVSGWRCHIF